jgi:hypothetical protein
VHIQILVGIPERKNNSEELGVDGRIILERIFGNRVGRCGKHTSGSGYRPVAGSCEHGDEPPGSIKGGEFPDWLSDY